MKLTQTKLRNAVKATVLKEIKASTTKKVLSEGVNMPSGVSGKLRDALKQMKNYDLDAEQKLYLLGEIFDSLGIPRTELSKISGKIKSIGGGGSSDDSYFQKSREYQSKYESKKATKLVVKESKTKSKR